MTKFPNDLAARVVKLAHSELNGYDVEPAKRKAAFHRDGLRLLREVARRAKLKKVRVSSNPGGIAIGGEVCLFSDEVFVQLSGGTFARHGILYRRGQDGPNRWEPWGVLLNVDNFAAKLARVAKEPYRKGP